MGGQAWTDSQMKKLWIAIPGDQIWLASDTIDDAVDEQLEGLKNS